MSVFSTGASGLGYVAKAGYSSWTSGKAFQGTYGSGEPRVGALFFAGLSSVDWADQVVSEVRLSLSFAAAGRNQGKSIDFYRGTKTGLWGTGSAMLGGFLGSVWTGSNAYNSTVTLYFNAASNAGIFEGLKSWLTGGLHTLAIYRNEGLHSSWNYSYNYLQISGASISVTYEPLGSKGTLSNESVLPDETVTLTIEPAALDGTLTHTVQWTFGEAASDVTSLAEGETEASFTVPYDWLYQIPDADSGEAACVLTTFVDGTETSSRSIPFTVSVPEEVFPTFTASVEPSGTTGGFYQYIGGAKLAFSGAESRYGAAITGYAVSGAEGVEIVLEEYVTPNFTESGAHEYTFTVTDSRGRTASQTLIAEVVAVADPVITAFSVQRYGVRVNDAGETVYEQNAGGDHVWITIAAQIDAAGGNNVPTATIDYGEADSGETVRIAVPWTSGGSYAVSDDRTLITATIGLNSAYGFTLIVADLHTSVTAYARVEKGEAVMHVGLYGVGHGGYSTATEDAPKSEFYHPAVFYGGTDGLMQYSSTEPMPTGKRWIDGKMIYAYGIPFGAIPNSSGVYTYTTKAPCSMADTVIQCVAYANENGAGVRPLPHLNLYNSNFNIHFQVDKGSDGYFNFLFITGSMANVGGGIAIIEFTRNDE